MRRKLELQEYLRCLVRIQTLRSKSLAFWQFICMPRMAAEGMKLSNINRTKDGVEVTPPAQPLYSLRHVSIEDEMLSTYDREISRDSGCYSDADIIDHVPIEYAELTGGGDGSGPAPHLIGTDHGAYEDEDDFDRPDKYRNSVLEVSLGAEFDDEGNIIGVVGDGEEDEYYHAVRKQSIVDEYERVHLSDAERRAVKQIESSNGPAYADADADADDDEASAEDIAFFDADLDETGNTTSANRQRSASPDTGSGSDRAADGTTATGKTSAQSVVRKAREHLTLGSMVCDSDDEVDGMSELVRPVMSRAKSSVESEMIDCSSTPQFRIATRKTANSRQFSDDRAAQPLQLDGDVAVEAQLSAKDDDALQQMDMLTLPCETVNSTMYYEQNLH